MRLYDYITEEVRRQGHDLSADEGQLRAFWMWRAWDVGRQMADLRASPTVADIRNLGRLVEPDKNAQGFRSIGVRVGSRLCPKAEMVPRMVARLVAHGEKLAPLEFYKEFEEIHPFVDGNGRTGKILLAWRRHTWDDPEFPPADLFGHPIGNP